MRTSLILLALWVLSSVRGAGAPLAEAISAHISQDQFRAATWGIKVVSASSGATLFAHNAGKLLKPASNAKLFTAALALDRLGVDYTIRTSIYSHRPPSRNGTLWSDLIVYGRGDPSMSARFNDGDWERSLDPLVDALEAAGVRRVRGDLVADDEYFRGGPFGSGWVWEDLQHYYGAPVSALTVDDNVIDLSFEPGDKVGDRCRVLFMTEEKERARQDWIEVRNETSTVEPGGERSITIHRDVGGRVIRLTGGLSLGDPPYRDAVAVPDARAWFLARLREALSRRGISISGKSRAGRGESRNLPELAGVESRPVPEIVEKMMKPSQNLYAQLLLMQVGARRDGSEGSTEVKGLELLREFVREIGIREGEVLMEEGSGLSRRSLVTPDAIVQLLQHMNRHGARAPFRASLPVAGVDGSLRRRLTGISTRGKVWAKTGTLRYVNALSGYVDTEGGGELVFSILLNAYGGESAREEIDRIVELLAAWDGA